MSWNLPNILQVKDHEYWAERRLAVFFHLGPIKEQLKAHTKMKLIQVCHENIHYNRQDISKELHHIARTKKR